MNNFEKAMAANIGDRFTMVEVCDGTVSTIKIVEKPSNQSQHDCVVNDTGLAEVTYADGIVQTVPWPAAFIFRWSNLTPVLGDSDVAGQ